MNATHRPIHNGPPRFFATRHGTIKAWKLQRGVIEFLVDGEWGSSDFTNVSDLLDESGVVEIDDDGEEVSQEPTEAEVREARGWDDAKAERDLRD